MYIVQGKCQAICSSGIIISTRSFSLSYYSPHHLMLYGYFLDNCKEALIVTSKLQMESHFSKMVTNH